MYLNNTKAHVKLTKYHASVVLSTVEQFFNDQILISRDDTKQRPLFIYHLRSICKYYSWIHNNLFLKLFIYTSKNILVINYIQKASLKYYL